MKPTTAIALSGGIDSLTAAYILKEQGHNLIGIHFITEYSSVDPGSVSLIADQLGIPLEVVDCSAEFKTKVVDYFTQSYLAGRTPNPCAVCNPLIKFGTVFKFAEQKGASSLATGHYAKTAKDEAGRYRLLKGTDSTKDQSYFLSFLSQSQLLTARFPLGYTTKQEVRKFASEKGLEPVSKKESQDICFIKGQHYGEFISEVEEFSPQPGSIQDTSGRILGKHNGLHMFTIGQRRGINCPAEQPYYVAAIDTEHNRLVVGFKEELLASECAVIDINWIGEEPHSPVKVHTQLRYRHTAAASTLYPSNNNTASVSFEKPQSAIAPGQCAVFYKEDEVLGAGWIT